MTFNQLKIIFFLLVLPLPNTQKKMHDTPAVMCQVELVSKQGSKINVWNNYMYAAGLFTVQVSD